jgi:hypothetical protein
MSVKIRKNLPFCLQKLGNKFFAVKPMRCTVHAGKASLIAKSDFTDDFIIIFSPKTPHGNWNLGRDPRALSEFTLLKLKTKFSPRICCRINPF